MMDLLLIGRIDAPWTILHELHIKIAYLTKSYDIELACAMLPLISIGHGSLRRSLLQDAFAGKMTPPNTTHSVTALDSSH
jgi:hypothetical protein